MAGGPGGSLRWLWQACLWVVFSSIFSRVEKLGKAQKFEVVSVKVGEVSLVTAPFEPLNAIGDMIKARFGDKVMLIGYANGYAHYGATQEKYQSFSYETRECDLDPSWIDAYFNALEKIL